MLSNLMIHNDVLRRLRYALRLNDNATFKLFEMVNYEMEPDYLRSIMKKEDEDGFLPCRDKILALFLDALIIKNRGVQEGKEYQPPSSGIKLTNNDILRKIRIAMSYKDDDMIELLIYANFRISKAEFSAFFRKPDHRNYKECGDQLLRNLLKGMVAKNRPDSAKSAQKPSQPATKYSANSAQKPLNRPKPENIERPSVWGEIKPK